MDMKLNRQFIFNCVKQRKPRDQSHALDLHQQLVTVTAAITMHRNNNKYYMVKASGTPNGIELIAHPIELEAL